MKKFLAAIALFALMFTALPASADHVNIPYTGQVRTDIVWFCVPNNNQMANLRMYFATGRFQEAGLSATDWSAAMVELVNSDQCSVLYDVTFVVKEIVESVRAPIHDNGQYGEVFTFYLLRVSDADSPNGPTFFIATF